MSDNVHFQHAPGLYACGVERAPWLSMVISSTRSPDGVTCRRCRRSLVFQQLSEAGTDDRGDAVSRLFAIEDALDSDAWYTVADGVKTLWRYRYPACPEVRQ